MDVSHLFQTSTLADVAPVHSRLDHMEMAYAKEVIDYNNRIIQGVVRPLLVQKFATAAESFNNLVMCLFFLSPCRYVKPVL